MGSAGSAHGTFQRAIARGNLTVAQAAARELGWLPLPDALAYCLLLLRQDRDRYPRAALRWHARWETEACDATLTESQLAIASLAALEHAPDEHVVRLLNALAQRGRPRRA